MALGLRVEHQRKDSVAGILLAETADRGCSLNILQGGIIETFGGSGALGLLLAMAILRSWGIVPPPALSLCGVGIALRRDWCWLPLVLAVRGVLLLLRVAVVVSRVISSTESLLSAPLT